MKKYIEIIGLGPPNLEEVAKQFWLADDIVEVSFDVYGFAHASARRKVHQYIVIFLAVLTH